MKYLVVIGRIMYSLIFLMAIMGHFKPETVGYAESKGVPAASFLVPLSGLMAGFGALSVILGYKTRAGIWLIILFLIPVTLMMHDFWNETDAMQAQMQMSSFMKNLSMLGAAFMISYFGAGPISIDEKQSLNHKAATDKLKY